MAGASIDLGPTTLTRDDDGIVHIKNQPGAELTLEDAQRNVVAVGELGQGRRMRICVDAAQIKSMSRDARHYFAGPEAATVVAAQAIVVSSPVGKVISNFFLGLNKPPFPTRLFTSKREARAWLLERKP